MSGGLPVLHVLAAQLQERLAAWTAAAASSTSASSGSAAIAPSPSRLGRPSSSSSSSTAAEAEAAGVGSWQSVEAAMYAIRAIARYVPEDESGVLPSLFGLLAALPRTHVELLSTSFRLVGRYHRWLAAHPAAVSPAFEFVVTNGVLPRPQAGRE